jgi:hypothetical protein
VLPAALVLSSCAFLLDFDELQKGGGVATGGVAGAGGEGAAGAAGETSSGGSAGQDGGAAGAGGGDGAPRCSADCAEDADPCTVVRCVDQGSGPECLREPQTGLVLEREYPPVLADRHYQLGMVAGASEFYLSTLSRDAGVSDAAIYRLGAADDAELSEATRVSTLAAAGVPVSRAALAVDESSGLLVHAYVALKDLTGAGARVWHVLFDADFKSLGRLPVGANYLMNPNLEAQLHHPDARKIGDAVWGTWINADGSVSVDNASNPRQFLLGSSAIPASTVTLLSTRANQPAVLYTGATHGAFLQSEAGGQAAVHECQTNDGVYYGAVAAPTSLAGLWFASWTKSGAGYLTTESKVVLCGPNGCAADTGCDTNEPQNLARNIAIATVHLQGDAAGLLYYLDVLPSVGMVDDGLSASIHALLVRMDFGTSATLTEPPVSSEVGDPVLLSTQSTSEAQDFRGPDLAAAALIGRTAAIGWVEPMADGRDQLRVQRYALCLP